MSFQGMAQFKGRVWLGFCLFGHWLLFVLGLTAQIAEAVVFGLGLLSGLITTMLTIQGLVTLV